MHDEESGPSSCVGRWDQPFAKSGMLQATRQAARREIAAATEVPEWEQIDNISEVLLGGFATVFGAAFMLLCTLGVQAVVTHNHEGPQDHFSIESLLENLHGRDLTSVMAACSDEHHEFRADISCWLQNADDIFDNDHKWASKAFLAFDCDRDFFVDATEVQGALDAHRFLCNGAAPAVTADSTTDVPRWTTAVATTTPQRRSDGSTTKASPTERPFVHRPSVATTTTKASAAPEKVGPLTIDEYRERIGYERQHAALEIAVEGVQFRDLSTVSLARLKIGIATIVSSEIGVSMDDVLDQQHGRGLVSLAGLGPNLKLGAACSVVVPYDMSLEEVRQKISSLEAKAAIASLASDITGRSVHYADVKPWVERGIDLASDISPLTPNELSKEDFVAYATRHWRLEGWEAQQAYEDLDRNDNGVVTAAELFA